MTQEEKSRNYDEAYKRVAIRFGSNVADEIFLKESEDERIRKELIYFLETEIPQCNARDKYIAWLEKQGEQKPAEWTAEDEKILSDIIKDLVHPWNEYIPDRIEEEIKWLKNKLKSLRHQSQWKPSDEQMKALKEAVDEHFDIDGGALWHLYEDLKKLREA